MLDSLRQLVNMTHLTDLYSENAKQFELQDVWSPEKYPTIRTMVSNCWKEGIIPLVAMEDVGRGLKFSGNKINENEQVPLFLHSEKYPNSFFY